MDYNPVTFLHNYR